MDTFTQSYIETALWSSTDDDGEPLDERFTIEELSPETLAAMEADCKEFQAQAAAAICGHEGNAGHDFWLTRNGHGAGFWDGDWPEPSASELTSLSKNFGECSLYIGDDGALYLFPPR